MLAIIWDVLDTRLRSPEEVADRLRLPLLARLPEPPSPDELVMQTRPNSSEAEPVRILRTSFDLAALGRDIRTVMIASAVQQEGKSTTLANLALAEARAGKRVVLVDLGEADGRGADCFEFIGPHPSLPSGGAKIV